MENARPTAPSAPAAKAADEIFCPSCGGIIKQKAEICPKCGVRIRTPFDKTALLVITVAAVVGFLAMISGIGIISASLIPILSGISAKDKVREATVVIANWETLHSAYASKETAAGDQAHIGFPDDSAASRYWSYAFEPEGETRAVFTAKAKGNLGKCRANSVLKSIFDAKKNRFVHEGDAACRNYVPGF